MTTQPNLKNKKGEYYTVVAHCNAEETRERFLSMSGKDNGTAKQRRDQASKMKWLKTNKREAIRFAKNLEKSPSKFLKVEVLP